MSRSDRHLTKLPSRCFLIILPIIIILGWVNSTLCATFKDSLGREVNLKREPGRIVSLAPNITEILFSLGLGEKVVGVTRFSYYPAEAAKKPKVGSYIHLNAEKIISLSPDLVIGTVAGNKPGVIKLVEQAGIQSFIVNARDIQQVLETITAVGRVCGVPDKADLLAMNLRSRLEKVRQKIGARRKPLVFLQINLKPIMTVNSNSFLHDLIQQAGGINMAKDLEITYPRISIEEVIMRRPEVIIISSMDRSGKFEKARQDWKKHGRTGKTGCPYRP